MDSQRHRAANKDLLDDGTLFVARFTVDGKVEWLPLVQGQAPLTAEDGFANQADILVKTRQAADLLKPTPMDRPEDIETNPVNGRVYVVLTNNGSRKSEQVDRANPRATNDHGHILEISPKDGDHGNGGGTWSIFLLAGKPGQDAGARYHRATSDNGWLSCPDNIAFDSKGRIWIVTDGAPHAAGVADGVYGADTTGVGRALTCCFYQAPTGGEVCGPIFTPDDTTFFLAVQHPGEDTGSTSRSRRRAGRTSRTACRRGRRSSPSPRKVAVRLAARRRLPPSRPFRTASPAVPAG